MGSDELLSVLPDAIAAMAEPMVSHDCAAFYLLSKAASQSDKLVMCGQGADEAFAGYHWYPKVHASDLPDAAYINGFVDRPPEAIRQHLNDEWLGSENLPIEFVKDRFRGAGSPLQKALRLDLSIMMPDDPVKRIDNMTMRWGVEARVPFLDHRLIEFVLQIPAEYQLQNGGKNALKTVARDYLPDDLIYRPKGYFPVPPLKFLRGRFLDLARGALTSPAAR